MSFFIESVVSDERQMDGYELREAVRLFHTSYTSLEACKTDPDCPRLPWRDPATQIEYPGDQHPNDPAMTAVRLEFHKVDDGCGDLVVHYAWAPNDPASTPYHWGFNEKVGKVSLPIFYKHRKRINNGTASFMYAWEPADTNYTEIEEVYLVKQLTRRIKKLLPEDVETIISQHRRIHTFTSTRKYMYLAPTIVPIDNFYDQITHHWMHDYGTPSPRSGGSGPGRWDPTLEDDIAFPPDIVQDPGDIIQGFPVMIRKPFTFLVPIMQPATEDTIPPKPRIVGLNSALDDPQHYKDWRTLPLPGMEGIN